MKVEHKTKQAALAAKLGKGLISFTEYHSLMYAFYEEV